MRVHAITGGAKGYLSISVLRVTPCLSSDIYFQIKILYKN